MTARLVIVPARGGSKRLPGKNLRSLAGRPLIDWTAKALAESELAAECLLTTDDPEIAEAGRKTGWLVPFLRPAELARDESPTIDAVIHALNWYSATRGSDPDIVILLQLTSPFRSGRDIRDAVLLLEAHRNASAVVGMMPHGDGRHGSWIVADGFVRRADGQPAKEAYEPNGAIYAIRADVLRQARDFYPQRTLAHVMPAERSIDIDDADDWRRAEELAKAIA